MLSYLSSSYSSYVEDQKRRQKEEANQRFDEEALRIADLEDPRDGTVPIDFKMRQLNY